MIKNIIVACIGVVSLIFIINPTAGFIELIPDNMPFIGNLDEAGATLLLISALAYFNIDIAKIFKNPSISKE